MALPRTATMTSTDQRVTQPEAKTAKSSLKMAEQEESQRGRSEPPASRSSRVVSKLVIIAFEIDVCKEEGFGPVADQEGNHIAMDVE